jgi:hypothetical protein
VKQGKRAKSGFIRICLLHFYFLLCFYLFAVVSAAGINEMEIRGIAKELESFVS